MRATLTAVAMVTLVVACATAFSPTPASGAQTFAGEVWTWDTKDSTVTLWINGQRVRVKTTPEQMRTLRHHEFARITGELAPPSELHVITASGPVTPVPKGAAQVTELQGTIGSVEPSGRLAINADRGPIHIWVASGADQRFTKGAPVTVKMSVQPVDLVPARGTSATAPAPADTPSASPSSEPGDHAVVTGHIMGVNPGGVLVVESPTGPIQVIVSDANTFKVGDAVQVRTTVRSGS